MKIASADPTVARHIDPNYFDDPDDLRVLRDGIRMTREVFAQTPYDPYRGSEYAPGANITSDADLNNYIRNNANTLYHPVGTCKMGADGMAVVDAQLRVRGLDGLRVVEGAIMQHNTSGNTN